MDGIVFFSFHFRFALFNRNVTEKFIVYIQMEYDAVRLVLRSSNTLFINCEMQCGTMLESLDAAQNGGMG